MRVLGKPASGASSEPVATVNRAKGRIHGSAGDWTRLGSSFNWAVMAGFPGPGEGGLSDLA